MNREIKIRAWDNQEGLNIMYYGVSFTTYGEGWTGGNPKHKYYKIDLINGGFFSASMKYIDLMLYTGLKDNNGTEIYEGDVINCSGRIYICEWNNNSAGYAWKTEKGNYVYPFSDLCKEAIIIGNIYEGKK